MHALFGLWLVWVQLGEKMSKSKRAKRTLRKQMLHKQFGELVKFMVDPIKRTIDYCSLARHILSVEPLEKDE